MGSYDPLGKAGQCKDIGIGCRCGPLRGLRFPLPLFSPWGRAVLRPPLLPGMCVLFACRMPWLLAARPPPCPQSLALAPHPPPSYRAVPALSHFLPAQRPIHAAHARTAKRVRRPNPRRSALAAAGKCDSDAATLVGSSGTCRRTCGDCVDCPKGDIICLRKNVRGLRSIEAAAAARGSGAAP